MNKNTEFLEVKEKRFNKVKSLVNETHCVVQIKVNYPGNQKLNAFTFFVFHEMIRDLNIELDEVIYGIEGPIGVKRSSEDSLKLKAKFITFEDTHPLGRLIDCDVLTHQGMISRSDFNMAMRQCLVCNQEAHVCIVSKKHEIKIVKQAFHNHVIEYCKRDLTRQITFAMFGELSTFPGFGLVNPIDNGIHNDMDCTTFIRSIYAISPHFKRVYKLNSDLPSNLYFQQLRQLGIEIERFMFEATKGVNTHKGLIFLLLMIIGAKHYHKDLELKEGIKKLAVYVQNDFKEQPTTTGLRWYHKANIMGIRKVVLDGMSHCMDVYLPSLLANLEQYVDCNDAFVATQLLVMSETQDTTILKRGGMKKLHELQEFAKVVMHTPSKWQHFSDWCISNQLSPGGSADLLAVLVMLAYFFYDKNEEML